MKRRKFIETSSLLSSFLLFPNSIVDIGKFQLLNNSKTSLVDPLIPIRIYKQFEDEILAQIIKMRQKFGFRRFMLLSPDKTVRFSGFPQTDEYEDIGNRLLKFKNKLEKYDIEIGWECSATIKQGPSNDYQVVTGINGKVSDISFCPLDENFSNTLSNNFKTVVAIAKPFMVIVEDDFTIRHAGSKGCFCPLHLDEFAKLKNRYFSREELQELFKGSSLEGIKLKREWAELMKDSLVKLAKGIRREVDLVAPETRILLCQPGSADFEGDFTMEVTKALAGNTRPAVRLYGTSYGTDSGMNLPRTVFHLLYSIQHLPENFELFHESDTFPHSRFYMSSSNIKSLMTIAFAYGVDSSRFHPFQNIDNQLEDEGYGKMFKEQVLRFTKLRDEVKDCKLEGCEVYYNPHSHIVGNPSRYAWANVLGRLGIPYTTKGGKVKMISGGDTRMMTDEEIKTLLSGAVFLDGYAAHDLYNRGFEDLIGAEVLPGENPKFKYEGINAKNDFSNIDGEIMYNFLMFGSVGPEGGRYYEMKPLKGTKILTKFLDGDLEPVMPGLVTTENKLGGRVAITAFDFSHNRSSAILNYKKKEIISQTIEWLGREPLPVFVRDLPNIFCVYNKKESSNEAIILLVNMGADSFDSVPIVVGNGWERASVLLMDNNGKWKKCKYSSNGRVIKVHTKINYIDPLVLKISQ